MTEVLDPPRLPRDNTATHANTDKQAVNSMVQLNGNMDLRPAAGIKTIRVAPS